MLIVKTETGSEYRIEDITQGEQNPRCRLTRTSDHEVIGVDGNERPSTPNLDTVLFGLPKVGQAMAYSNLDSNTVTRTSTVISVEELEED